MIDNATGDSLFVPPVEVSGPRSQRYTIAGVANLTTPSGEWQTDVRLFNGSAASTTATRELTVAAAAVTQLELQPNEFRQDNAYNASVSVRGVGGSGRVIAYASWSTTRRRTRRM